MAVYATNAELAAYLGTDAPSNAGRLLDRASEVIDDHTGTAIYEVDENDMPTDAVVIAAFSKATCAQVEMWLAGHEEDDILGPVDSVSLGGVTAKGLELAPRAARALRDAGLYSNDPVTP